MSEPAKQRVKAFTRMEDTILYIAETQARYPSLFSAFGGAGGGRKRKAESWEAVAAALNSQSDSGCVRTVQQLKKRYENIKGEAKRKAGEAKRPPTGGGPPPPKPTEAERMFLEMMGDAPSVVGLSGGLESGELEPVSDLVFPVHTPTTAPAAAEFAEPSCASGSPMSPIPIISLSSLPEPQKLNPCPRPAAGKARKPNNQTGCSDLLYREVLELEKRRIEAELLLAQFIKKSKTVTLPEYQEGRSVSFMFKADQIKGYMFNYKRGKMIDLYGRIVSRGVELSERVEDSDELIQFNIQNSWHHLIIRTSQQDQKVYVSVDGLQEKGFDFSGGFWGQKKEDGAVTISFQAMPEDETGDSYIYEGNIAHLLVDNSPVDLGEYSLRNNLFGCKTFTTQAQLTEEPASKVC